MSRRPTHLLSIVSLLVALASFAPGASSQATIGYDVKSFEVGGSVFDSLGRSIAVDPFRLIVGANGDGSSGAVFAYKKQAGSWNLQQVFKGLDTLAGDFFAWDVALDGTTLLVGASQHDTIGFNSGAAYLFEEVGGSWVQTDKLLAPDGAASDKFGYSVALEGDVLVVSAPFTGDNGTNSGSAYVYRDVAGNWSFEQELHASTADANDQFGWEVAIKNGRIVATAIADEDGVVETGAAFSFGWNGSSWVEDQRVLPVGGAGGDRFGWDIDLEGERMFVSSPEHGGVGSVLVYEHDGSAWTFDQELQPSKAGADAGVGWSLDAWGDRVLMGAPGTAGYSGGIYSFHHNGVSWLEVQQGVTGEAAGGFPPPQMGMACGLVGKTAFGGAPFGFGDAGVQAGALYQYDLSDIGLDAVPDVVPPLGVLTLENHGGFPALGSGVYLVDISGIPVAPTLVAMGTSDAGGEFSASFPMPASASGNTATLIGAGLWKPGVVAFSGLVDVSFQ
jgi:hypothetical protein